MIILLSPSKTLDMEYHAPKIKTSTPALLSESETLAREVKKLSTAELKGLMKISDKLAELNHSRFQSFSTPFAADNAKPCGFAFKGDVYDGLQFDTLSPDDMAFAQKHLRILSGLYGLLRPLDLMQAYRLEMGTRLANPRGKNLYEFWGNRITEAINLAVKETDSQCVINLASNEYFSAVQPNKLCVPVISPTFKENKNGTLKIIGLMAKRARGRMANWLINNRFSASDALCNFALDRYQFDPRSSTNDQFIYTRSPAA